MRSSKSITAIILIAAPFAIVLTILLSVLYGAKNIDASTVWEAIVRFDPDNVNHQIVMHSRLPRVIGALLIGAFLAISGALMQGMTRNYLASPSILGISDGSAFVITLMMIMLPGASSMEMIIGSLIGSALSVGIIFGLASIIPGGTSPVRMAILGTIIGTFLSSVSAAIATYFQISQNISFWYNARLNEMNPDMIKFAIPFAIVGIVLAVIIANSITVLSLGSEVATSLGQKTALIKAVTMLSVIILTGIAVALAGKIGFVGLIIPHITRFLIGVDYKWIIPCAGVIGAVFLGLSDVLSRFLNYPFEMPVGVVTAIIGVPFFLYLIRKKGGRDYA
ncbi:iron ABC transporter permease [Paenibacillus sp. UMB4589-SE434]|uniref:FecCD family ABC transporter permease n=1 Tax=Paenibacillus sp. UMB4589-SE434 TaxID=3046314 RepID=UPI00254E64F5|nr:iron ABC transporter permease [Paenibacillus sp. UMB4589-SE434]MDK8181908.1 iron ABC transporter permease [Paenibacillus sp. UMB4589-SE434]